MVLVIRRASRGIGPPLSHASAWPGRFLAVTRQRSGPAMLFFTIRPGAWARRAFGRIRPSSPSLTASALPNKLEYPDLAGAPSRPRTAPRYLDRSLRALVILLFPKDFRSKPRQPTPPYLAEPFLRNPGISISVWSSSSMRTWSARCQGILCSPLAMQVHVAGTSWWLGMISIPEAHRPAEPSLDTRWVAFRMGLPSCRHTE